MPRIPTHIASELISPGPAQPQAPEIVFNAAPGAQGISRGLMNLGQSVDQISEIQQRKKAEDDRLAAEESFSQFREVMDIFRANPDNQASETFADDYKEYHRSQESKYLANLGSKDSQTWFKRHSLNYYNDAYSNSLNVANRVRLDKATDSFSRQTMNAMTSYRTNLNIPGADAIGGLNSEMRRLFDAIEFTFGESAPKTALVLQQHLVSEAIKASASKHPDYARRILEQSDLFEETDRKTLAAYIDDTQKQSTRLSIWHLHDANKKDLEDAERFMTLAPPVPKAVFIASYGPGNEDAAEVAYLEHEQDRKDVNDAVATIIPLKGQNIDSLLKATDKAAKDTSISAKTAQTIQKFAGNLAEQAQKDSFTYVASNNPEAVAAMQLWSGASDAQKPAYYARFLDITRMFQGHAPKDAENPEWFLGKETGQIHVLQNTPRFDGDPGEAATLVEEMMASPQQMIQKFQELKARYQDPSHFDIALQDLATLPPPTQRLDGKYQLVPGIMHLPWASDYIGAQQNQQSLKEFQANNETRQQFEYDLNNNEKFTKFARSIMGDNWQRSESVKGYKEGILNYAWALTARGTSRGVAIDTAIERLFEGYFTDDINGQDLTTWRYSRDMKSRMGDVEGEDLYRRLGMSLTVLDTKTIHPAQISRMAQSPGERPEELPSRILNAIVQSSFFQIEPSGRAVTLYIQADGNRFQLRDKDNQPYRISFDNLPTFMGATVFEGLGTKGEQFKPTSIKSEKQFVPPDWLDDEFTHWPMRQWSVIPHEPLRLEMPKTSQKYGELPKTIR